jgi:hypothetical protein
LPPASEMQALISWGIKQPDLTQADPPICIEGLSRYVEGMPHGEKFRQTNASFSEFVLQATVHQTACFTEIGGNAAGNASTAEIVKASFLPLGLPIWPYPVYPSQLFGGNDVLIELDQDGDKYCWFGLRRLRKAL